MAEGWPGCRLRPEMPPVVAASDRFAAVPPVLPSVPGGGAGAVFALSCAGVRPGSVAGPSGVRAPCRGRGRTEGLLGAAPEPMDGEFPLEEPVAAPPPAPLPPEDEPEDEPCAQAAPTMRLLTIKTAGMVMRMCLLPTKGYRTSTRRALCRFQISDAKPPG